MDSGVLKRSGTGLLIEPHWNVNYCLGSGKLKAMQTFNRTTLECKSIYR